MLGRSRLLCLSELAWKKDLGRCGSPSWCFRGGRGWTCRCVILIPHLLWSCWQHRSLALQRFRKAYRTNRAAWLAARLDSQLCFHSTCSPSEGPLRGATASPCSVSQAFRLLSLPFEDRQLVVVDRNSNCKKSLRLSQPCCEQEMFPSLLRSRSGIFPLPLHWSALGRAITWMDVLWGTAFS